jgi:hypothetical protein
MNWKGVEERGHGLIGRTVQYWNLPEVMEENHKKPYLGEAVPKLRFYPWIS